MITDANDCEGRLTVFILREADQSALISVINALFSDGSPLLSVRCLQTAPSQADTAEDQEFKT
ncbi:MAG: hypothetical protein ACFLMY_00730 [Candidatus Brachytrichaceae bacterium NZ_4S206]